MAARHAQRANTDPRNLSPKAKYAGIAGVAATGAITVVAAFLSAIPGEALAGLGVWSVPVGAAIATVAAFLGAYAKHDPARDPSLALDEDGQVYASVADAEGETERYVSGHYSNNRLTPEETIAPIDVSMLKVEGREPLDGVMVNVADSLAAELAEQDEQRRN